MSHLKGFSRDDYESFHVRSTSVLRLPSPICFKFGMFVDIYYTNTNAHF